MVKKLILFILLAALMLSLVSCSSGGSSVPDDASPSVSPNGPENAETADDPVSDENVDDGFDIKTADLSPEWISSLEQAENARQLFVVAGIGETTAYISMHEKDSLGKWRQIMTTPGYIGKYGLGKTKEGDAKTPVGTFGFNYAFGIADDPGCAIEYHQVDGNAYWSGDQRDGYHYNEMVDIRDYPDLKTDDCEHIVDYTSEYQYCLNISYNDEGTPGLGSAIFLHCLGQIKPYTGGCVAIPQDKMISVMKNVSEECVVVIDSLRVLSPDTWNSMGLSPVA